MFLKIEGFNFASSIKLKAAAEMVKTAERDGTLTPDSILVESSSGNLGVALSMLTANKGYRFVCVTDSRCNPATMRLMRVLGADVHVVTEPAADGSGLLGARLAHVRELCASDDRYLWLNQYANPANPRAHYRTTAPAIAQQFPGPRRAVRRRGHVRDADGLRKLHARVAATGPDRRDRQVGSVSSAARQAAG